jgi:hypothetical protein
LRFIPAAPDRAGTPVCYVESSHLQQLPDTSGGEPWWAHVLYVPEELSPLDASYKEVLEAGGIDIQLSSARRRARPPLVPDEHASGGGYAPTEVRGNPGVVQRVWEDLVLLSWTEELPGNGLSRGQFLGLNVQADYSPEELVAFGREFETGVPRDARAPLESLPAPSTGTGGGEAEMAPPPTDEPTRQ